MSDEILCTYSFYGNDEATDNYFFIDSSINWKLLRKFFQDQIHPTEGFTIHAQSRLIDSPQALDELLKQENEIHFIIQDANHLPHPIPVPKQEHQNQSQDLPKESSKKKLQFGPTITHLLEQIGINPANEEFCEVEQLNEFLQHLPFFPMIKMVAQQPQFLEGALLRVSDCFQVDHAALVSEVHDLLDILDPFSSKPKSESKNESESQGNFPFFGDFLNGNFMADPWKLFFPAHPCPSRKEEAKQESESPRSSPSEKEPVQHSAICDNCDEPIRGIRYKCMKCPDYDLCDSCESLNGEKWFHDETHCFAKMYRASSRPTGMPTFPHSFVPPFGHFPPPPFGGQFPHPPPPFGFHFGGFHPEGVHPSCHRNEPRRPRETPRIDSLEQEVASLKEALKQLNIPK